MEVKLSDNIRIRTKRGSELHPDDRKHVLRAYVHRHTGDHPAGWAGKQPVMFSSDQEWLENTHFTVKQNGRIDRRYDHTNNEFPWPGGKIMPY